MAFLKNGIWIRNIGLCLILVFLWIQDTKEDVTFTQTVDMAGRGCDEQTATQITDSDVVQVYARPPQLPSGEGTRDSCTVELVTNNNRRIRIYILDIVIYDCGTFIKIFDTEQQMVKPRWTLDCNTKSGQKFISAYSRVLIKLEKLSAQSINFKYSFALTTSQGPDVEFEQAESNFRQEILTDGAIAGIGVAAAVVLLAIILIIIFLVVRLKKIRREDDEIAMSSKGGSTNGRSRTTFQSRHYSHSQDMSSIDSRDAPYTNGFSNGAYKDESPNKEVKSILKTEKIEERKVNKSPFIIRQSHRESNRSLDKPCLDDTDVSEGDYYSDSSKIKRDAERKKRRSSRQRSKSSGHSDNERNDTKDRERARSRTRSEKSRLQSETDKDMRSRSEDPLLTLKREKERHQVGKRVEKAISTGLGPSVSVVLTSSEKGKDLAPQAVAMALHLLLDALVPDPEQLVRQVADTNPSHNRINIPPIAVTKHPLPVDDQTYLMVLGGKGKVPSDLVLTVQGRPLLEVGRIEIDRHCGDLGGSKS
ncbi:hypothetical protein LOTGIDRAFT_173574 [Lottia gigantea]|uniref:CUB domain-containing protein n=1 Tax=Lottia gigantea TaxID=225164 RepID=V4AR61_LOTGI|nr:hypothetical protein LOTGIDRAFT_173574 [Lottia gigantea]ESO99737.1 hypothetical protein LOTGIDRAFT_173574 [Lottia gigantea]